MLKQLLHIIAILSVFSTSAIQAQSKRNADPNNMLWIAPAFDLKFTPQWSLYVENQIRRDEFGAKWAQYQLRTAVHYRINSHNSVMAGYVFTETYSYGIDPIAKKAFPEHRIYEQYQNKNMLGKAEYYNRYRLEQRFIGNANLGTFDGGKNYKNRARYLTRVNYPVTKKFFNKGGLYVAFYDELMIGFGKNVRYNVFDQNRIFGGVGYVIDKNSRIECGYLQQTLAHGDGILYEYNSSIQINYTFNIPLYSEKK